MERMHEEFIGNKELMKATMTRELKRENYKLWHDMDVEDAKQEGLQQGQKQQLIQLLMLKYTQENHEWIKECTSHQIKVMIQHIFEDISYEELKDICGISRIPCK